MKKLSLPALVALAVLVAPPVLAAEVTVNMVNKDSEGRAMQFEPAFVKVAPGDTVHFVAKDKGHDSEALAGGIPEGADGWKGKISQDVSVTLTEPGLYAYKCTPHFGLGMVGLIEVGDDTSNIDAIKGLKLPAKAQARMTELLSEAESGGAAAPADAPASSSAAQ
jgi:pseudoazurin